MKYSRKGMVITFQTDELLILLDRSIRGTPAGRGWGVFPDVECPICGVYSVAVAPIGTRGYRCTECGYTNPDFVWRDNLDNYDGATLWPVGWEKSRISKN